MTLQLVGLVVEQVPGDGTVLGARCPEYLGSMLTSTAISSVGLNQLGELPRLSDTPRARRARLHQAWFRAAVLRVSQCGTTPAGRPLGSILPPGAAAEGLNFTSAAARDLFLARRQQGWGVDPVRMTSHLTSSQALVNLLGPLFEDWDWLAEVLRGVLGRPDIAGVRDAEVEFAPTARSRYLGDMTRVDAFFRVSTPAGVEGVVLELKYIDRFSTRKMPIAQSQMYIDLASSVGLWRAPVEALNDFQVSQLLRCQALGARTLQVEQGRDLPATLLLVSHPLDPLAGPVFDRYVGHLRDPSSAAHVTLDQFLSSAYALAPHDRGRESMRALHLRYIDHDRSEALWREHLLVTSRRGAGAGRRGQ